MSSALSAIIILLIITFVIEHGNGNKLYLGFNRDQIITITSGMALLIGVVLIVPGIYAKSFLEWIIKQQPYCCLGG